MRLLDHLLAAKGTQRLLFRLIARDIERMVREDPSELNLALAGLADAVDTSE